MTLEQKQQIQETTCKRLFHTYGIAFQDLWSKRSSTLTIEATDGLAMIADMSDQHCTDAEARKQFLGLLSKLVNVHQGKIGIILPLSTKPHAKQILRGIEASLRAQNIDPKKTLLVFDSQSRTQLTEQYLVEMIFHEHVTAVMGGYEAADAATLKSWSSRVLMPTFLLNDQGHTAMNPWSFYTYPSQRHLARSLVQANKKYGQKKISVMRPTDSHSDEMVNLYIDEAKKAGIDVMHNVVYDPKRIDQMEAAARKLFQIEPSDRRDELQRLYETAKQDAKHNNQPFNVRMISLQPIVAQDAIFIADNFRTARHMAKVLTFLGVRKLPLFGGIEWRSPGIIQPFDPLFNRGFFVDFIGSYDSAPQELRVPTEGSPYFIASDKVEDTDFALLGYHAIEAPLILTKALSTPRRKLLGLLPRQDEKAPNKPAAFDSMNMMNWPTYIFKITQQGSEGILSLD